MYLKLGIKAALILSIFTLTACKNENIDAVSVSQFELITPQNIISIDTPMPTQIITPEPSIILDDIEQIVCTAEESAQIKSSSSEDSNIIGRLPFGEVADVIEASDEDWTYIIYENISGYIYRKDFEYLSCPDIPVPEGEWTNILVNPTHYLPCGFVVNLADFEGGKVDISILEISEQMFKDAEEDGINLKLVDAYRTYERQDYLYKVKVESYIDKGFNQAEAEIEAAKITARPNTSEHQTGLALDIVTDSYTKRDKGFENTEAYDWLSVNAHNYGFILRYKADKTSITKVIYEPWHWRFVGKEAATAMKINGECFEEYLGILD